MPRDQQKDQQKDDGSKDQQQPGKDDKESEEQKQKEQEQKKGDKKEPGQKRDNESDMKQEQPKGMQPKEGGQQLITTMWQTKGRRFGNASQNYSQIILACFLRLNELVTREGLICPVEREPKPEGPDTSSAPLDDI